MKPEIPKKNFPFPCSHSHAFRFMVRRNSILKRFYEIISSFFHLHIAMCSMRKFTILVSIFTLSTFYQRLILKSSRKFIVSSTSHHDLCQTWTWNSTNEIVSHFPLNSDDCLKCLMVSMVGGNKVMFCGFSPIWKWMSDNVMLLKLPNPMAIKLCKMEILIN